MGLTSELTERSREFLTAAAGLTASLAWNDAFNSTIDYFYPLEKKGPWLKLIYALIITIMLVILIWTLNRNSEKSSDKEDSKVKK